jgi:hypothetical protein
MVGMEVESFLHQRRRLLGRRTATVRVLIRELRGFLFVPALQQVPHGAHRELQGLGNGCGGLSRAGPLPDATA